MKLNLIIAQELNRYQGKIKFLIPEKCVPVDKTPNLCKNMLRICFISAEFFQYSEGAVPSSSSNPILFLRCFKCTHQRIRLLFLYVFFVSKGNLRRFYSYTVDSRYLDLTYLE